MTENSSNNNSNSDSYDFTIILSIILFSCIIYLFQQLLNSVNILSIEKNNELFENVINSIYFSVTTFSTVGFGDISTNTSFMSKITIWSMLFILIAYEIFNYDIYDDTEYKNSNKFKHFFEPLEDSIKKFFESFDDFIQRTKIATFFAFLTQLIKVKFKSNHFIHIPINLQLLALSFLVPGFWPKSGRTARSAWRAGPR